MARDEDNKEIQEALADILKVVSEHIDDGDSLYSFIFTAELMDEEGNISIARSAVSADIVGLIGQIEVVKAILLNAHKEHMSQDRSGYTKLSLGDKVEQEVSEADMDPALKSLKDMIVNKKDKPN